MTTAQNLAAAAREALLQRFEADLEYALTDVLGELALLRGRAVELRAPLGKGAVAVFQNPNNRSPLPTSFEHVVSQASQVLDA